MKMVSVRSWLEHCASRRIVLLRSVHVRSIVLLCSVHVLLVCVCASPTKWNSLKKEREPWLSDGSFYDIDYMDHIPQADGGPAGAQDMCPPVSKILPEGGCDLKECRSDRECEPQGLMCCYNGCVYTCFPEVRPAAFFDWMREPRRRLQFGRSWLITGRGPDSDMTVCSTTPPDDDSDPLMCPHGYQCVIDDQGNPPKGVPNTGHCVQSQDASSPEIGSFDTDSQISKEKTDTAALEEPKHHCRISESNKLLSGHSVVLNGKNCLCYETKLICDD